VKPLLYTIALMITTSFMLLVLSFGHWLGSSQYHRVFQDQQIMIAHMERENKRLALTNNYRFEACQNVLDKLGLIDQYKMSMGGE